MAKLFRYKCEKCGFELTSSEEHYFFLMSGTYLLMRCLKCHDVRGYWIGGSCFTPGSIQFSQELIEFGRNLEGTCCKSCGAQHHLVLWSPDCGCPKCRGKLVQQDVAIMAD